MSIDTLIGIWVVGNVIALVVTFTSLIDARQNRSEIQQLTEVDGRPRRSRDITTSADVRREVMRIVMAALMMAALIPSLFLVAMPLVPLALAVTCLFDARDRRRLGMVTAAEIVVERDTSIQELVRLVKENTVISQGASDKAQKASDNAQAAFHEANDVNQKIATQGAQIVAQGERQDRRDATADRLQVVADDTAEKVTDIHDVTVHPEAAS